MAAAAAEAAAEAEHAAAEAAAAAGPEEEEEDFGAVEVDVEGDAQLGELALAVGRPVLEEGESSWLNSCGPYGESLPQLEGPRRLGGFTVDRTGLRTFLAVAKGDAVAYSCNPCGESLMQL